MVREVLESLRCKPGGIYVDGTVGGGGHALAILKASSPDGLLVESIRMMTLFRNLKISCRPSANERPS